MHRLAIMGALFAATVSCVHTVYVCQPAPPRDLMPEVLALVGPPRLVPDSTVPSDRIVGRVLGQAGRGPIRDALVDLVSLEGRATTDSAGYFSLLAPPVERVLLRIRAIGYIMRRDTLRVATLPGHRIEVVLPDAYAFGDIEGIPCLPKRRLWPFH